MPATTTTKTPSTSLKTPQLVRAKKFFETSEFRNHQTLARDVASLFIPRRSNILNEQSTGTTQGWYEHIFEPAPQETVKTLAQGQYNLLFTGKWFETAEPEYFVEPVKERQDSFEEVGKRMLKMIANSNFKLEAQEFLHDRSSIHTSLMLIEEDEEDVFYCTHVPSGHFAIGEDHRKRVDKVCRRFKLTARQAVGKFVRETDTLGKKIREFAGDDAKAEELFTFYHLIEPRKISVVGSDDPKEMPWASTYTCEEDDCVVRESGYQEKPFVCSRFDRWGDSPYGTGPSHVELPRARSLQKMKKTWLALGDRITSPGTFVGPDQDEDPNPFGPTRVSREDAAVGLPREWNTQGRYDVSVDAIDREINKMEESFYIPLFKLLTTDRERNREKTAFETAKMIEEQVGHAAPTFSRLDEEVIEPFLKRVFNIMLRAGMFADLEEHLVALDEEGNELGIAEPKIIYTSKLAITMKAFSSNTFTAFLNTVGYILEAKPDVLMNVDWDKTFRRLWKELGQPIDELLKIESVKQLRQQLLDAQMGQVAAERDELSSKAEKNRRAA